MPVTVLLKVVIGRRSLDHLRAPDQTLRARILSGDRLKGITLLDRMEQHFGAGRLRLIEKRDGGAHKDQRIGQKHLPHPVLQPTRAQIGFLDRGRHQHIHQVRILLLLARSHCIACEEVRIGVAQHPIDHAGKIGQRHRRGSGAHIRQRIRSAERQPCGDKTHGTQRLAAAGVKTGLALGGGFHHRYAAGADRQSGHTEREIPERERRDTEHSHHTRHDAGIGESGFVPAHSLRGHRLRELIRGAGHDAAGAFPDHRPQHLRQLIGHTDAAMGNRAFLAPIGRNGVEIEIPVGLKQQRERPVRIMRLPVADDRIGIVLAHPPFGSRKTIDHGKIAGRGRGFFLASADHELEITDQAGILVIDTDAQRPGLRIHRQERAVLRNFQGTACYDRVVLKAVKHFDQLDGGVEFTGDLTQGVAFRDLIGLRRGGKTAIHRLHGGIHIRSHCRRSLLRRFYRHGGECRRSQHGQGLQESSAVMHRRRHGLRRGLCRLGANQRAHLLLPCLARTGIALAGSLRSGRGSLRRSRSLLLLLFLLLKLLGHETIQPRLAYEKSVHGFVHFIGRAAINERAFDNAQGQSLLGDIHTVLADLAEQHAFRLDQYHISLAGNAEEIKRTGIPAFFQDDLAVDDGHRAHLRRIQDHRLGNPRLAQGFFKINTVSHPLEGKHAAGAVGKLHEKTVALDDAERIEIMIFLAVNYQPAGRLDRTVIIDQIIGKRRDLDAILSGSDTHAARIKFKGGDRGIALIIGISGADAKHRHDTDGHAGDLQSPLRRPAGEFKRRQEHAYAHHAEGTGNRQDLQPEPVHELSFGQDRRVHSLRLSRSRHRERQ